MRFARFSAALIAPLVCSAPALAGPPAGGNDGLPTDVKFESGAAKPLITFGMISPTGEDVGQFSADELDSYLSAKLGGPVATRLYDTADALGDALANNTVEAAWLTPPAYVRASSKAKLTAIAKLSRHGATTYRSVIFTKADSKLKTLDDLTAKTFAWIGHDSASSNLYPRLLLEKGARDPKKMFRDFVKAGNHAEVCKAVLEGKADAGATFSDEPAAGATPVVDGCREAGFNPAKFKIMATTDPIPNDVIVARADLPAEVESHLQSALLEMAASPKGKEQLHDIFHADGFGKAADADFEPVRAAVKLLK